MASNNLLGEGFRIRNSIGVSCYFKHGTHVAGIAAGNGFRSNGEYKGVAPEATIIAIKILDAEGKGNSSDVLAGLQWLVDNKERYNIRVANLSIGTSDIGSKDPLVKAVEKAWDMGIFITIAAGNNGPGANSVTSPGISRKVLTVGASDDDEVVVIDEKTVENFSGRGPTSECIVKPDVVAPGTGIMSCTVQKGVTALSRPEYYVRLSGTSMSTPMASGAVAVLLGERPYLMPDDIKLLFKKTSRCLRFNRNRQGWGLIDLKRLLDEED